MKKASRREAFFPSNNSGEQAKISIEIFARRTTTFPGLNMWYIYILRCQDGSLYTGSTTDIPRRVNEHNRSKGGAYTRACLPVKLVYKESCSSRSKAQKRESQIKRWSRSKKLALIQQDKQTLSLLSRSRD